MSRSVPGGGRVELGGGVELEGGSELVDGAVLEGGTELSTNRIVCLSFVNVNEQNIHIPQ